MAGAHKFVHSAADPDSAGNPGGMGENAPAMMRTMPVRALVIDDDTAVCRQVVGWLHEADCDAVSFTQADEGVRYAREVRCQVALVDLRLAEADGVDVIAALHRDVPETRLIALGAFPDAPLIIRALRAGARDVLEKPVQPGPLRAAVERQLAEGGLIVRNEQEFNQRLGARLRGLRTAANRTLADVAEQCGLTVAQVSQIELGKSATSTWTLARLAAALRTPLDRLFTGL